MYMNQNTNGSKKKKKSTERAFEFVPKPQILFYVFLFILSLPSTFQWRRLHRGEMMQSEEMHHNTEERERAAHRRRVCLLKQEEQKHSVVEETHLSRLMM